MTKKKDKNRHIALIQTLERISSSPYADLEGNQCEDESLNIDSLANQLILDFPDNQKTFRMKKFRFQLLHHWLINNFEPCRAADIGGGKGLLSYLLMKSGWKTAVIDPVQQLLPDKYKDIRADTRVKISPKESTPFIPSEFMPEMGKDFDLLIGMHAHGCNAKIMDAAAEYGCGFVLFPCCVIDEPFYPRLGVHWLECLTGYAIHKGLAVKPFRLNFKGQNIGICCAGKAPQPSSH
jgi:hypothetical protein